MLIDNKTEQLCKLIQYQFSIPFVGYEVTALQLSIGGQQRRLLGSYDSSRVSNGWNVFHVLLNSFKRCKMVNSDEIGIFEANNHFLSTKFLLK